MTRLSVVTLASLLALFTLASCAGQSEAGGSSSSTSSSSSSSTGGAGSSSAGANSSSAGASCDPVTVGRWSMGSTANNDCFGMDMSMRVDFVPATCAITFSMPNMNMDRPSGAVVAGSQVTFQGGQGGSWAGCTGTLSGGNRIVGACGGGLPCTFTMTIP